MNIFYYKSNDLNNHVTYNFNELKADNVISCLLPIIDNQISNKVLEMLNNTILIFGQPDIFIIKNVNLKHNISNKQELDKYINDLKIKLIKKINEVYCNPYYYVGASSNAMISSVEFCSITSEKKRYLAALKQFIVPKTYLVDYVDEKYDNLKPFFQDENSKYYIKTSYASANRCISNTFITLDEHKKTFESCLNKYNGFIVQEEQKIIEEIRFLTLGGEICICFILTSEKHTDSFSNKEIKFQKWTFFFIDNIPYKLYKILADFWNINSLTPEQGWEEIKIMVKNIYNETNIFFKLNEFFMRIDLFFCTDGKVYLNEIEPFASGRGQRCADIMTQCQIIVNEEVYRNNDQIKVKFLGILNDITICQVVSMIKSKSLIYNIQRTFKELFFTNYKNQSFIFFPQNVVKIDSESIYDSL